MAIPAGIHGEALLLKVMRMQGRGSALAWIKSCISRTGIMVREKAKLVYNHQAVCDQHIDSFLHVMTEVEMPQLPWLILTDGVRSQTQVKQQLPRLRNSCNRGS